MFDLSTLTTKAWQPVEGSFSRNFSAEFPVASAQVPTVDPRLIQLPTSVLQTLESITLRSRATGELNDFVIEEMRTICRAEGAPNYSTSAGAFLSLYFEKNAQKVAAVIHSQPTLCLAESVRILDLGAGPASSSVGVVSALLSRKTPPVSIHLDLIERNETQAKLAEEILTAWIEKESVPLTFSVLRHDVSRGMQELNESLHSRRPRGEPARYDLILSSYLVTEMESKAASDLVVELLFHFGLAGDSMPALLFLGSYAEGNHFGYHIYNPAGDPTFAALETTFKAFGLGEDRK